MARFQTGGAPIQLMRDTLARFQMGGYLHPADWGKWDKPLGDKRAVRRLACVHVGGLTLIF